MTKRFFNSIFGRGREGWKGGEGRKSERTEEKIKDARIPLEILHPGWIALLLSRKMYNFSMVKTVDADSASARCTDQANEAFELSFRSFLTLESSTERVNRRSMKAYSRPHKQAVSSAVMNGWLYTWQPTRRVGLPRVKLHVNFSAALHISCSHRPQALIHKRHQSTHRIVIAFKLSNLGLTLFIT